MTIKELFEKAENGVLTYEQFSNLAKENGIKLADLSEGKYVSTQKHTSELQSKQSEIDNLTAQIETLNSTITTRDADLANLQKQLEEAGQDANKLTELNTKFTDLQTKYSKDIEEANNKMRQQAYEFAVKEFANTKNFTSPAAKRDFTRAMIEKNLQLEDGKLLGAEDFVTLYSKDNAQSFVVENPEPPVAPEPTPAPIITAPTPGNNNNAGGNEGFKFNFRGVH